MLLGREIQHPLVGCAVQVELADLQRASLHGLLVTADIERGVGQQVAGATVFPHAMALGHAEEDAARYVEEAARATAREAIASGIHVALMPVADVNRNPRNPIIATRAFSDDARHAARCVRAYVRGCREVGLLTTAKHFPGHGGTLGDSHAELPVVADGRTVLERSDLPPFRAAVEAGVDMVMTAHVAFPALDTEARPATLSPRILGDVLRGDLGFTGTVISDSLLMESITDALEDVGTRAATLVAAGVDVLLDPEDPVAVVEGLVRAVEDGRLSAERLAEAAARVHALRQRVIARFGPDVFTAPEAATATVDWEANAALARSAARQAIHVEGDETRLWRLAESAGEGVLVIQAVAPACGAAADQVLRPALRDRLPGARVMALEPEANGTSMQVLQAAVQGAQHTVMVLQARPAAWHTYGLTRAQRDAVRQLVSEETVVAALGAPVLLDELPDTGVRICAFSDAPPAQEALVDTLAGRTVVVAQ